MNRFLANEQDIIKHYLGVSNNDIKENVIVAPWWEPTIFDDFFEIELLTKSTSSDIKVWNIKAEDIEITYIKTGIGASCFLEGLLPLRLTKCKKIVFIGSVGSLDFDIGIGDIVIPEYSVCGDEASRYLSSIDLTKDVFGEKTYPNLLLFNQVKEEMIQICEKNNIKWHIGKTFSIDTIFAQFAHIDTILNLACNTIEMESASAFKAAKLMQIPLVAIFSVSDNTVTNKSFVAGRSEEELNYRRYTRKTVFPQLIIRIFKNQKKENNDEK